MENEGQKYYNVNPEAQRVSIRTTVLKDPSLNPTLTLTLIFFLVSHGNKLLWCQKTVSVFQMFRLPIIPTLQRCLGGVGVAQNRGNVRSSHLAAPGLILGIPVIHRLNLDAADIYQLRFLEDWLSWFNDDDQTHLAHHKSARNITKME